MVINLILVIWIKLQINTIILIIVLFVKIPIDADCSALKKETELSHKAPQSKVGGGVRITKYENIFSKDYTKNWSRGMFVIDSVLKTNPWTYKIKDLNKENNRKLLWKRIFVE